MKYFGLTVLGDAYVIAWRIPNVLRRIFSEGLMTSVLLPYLLKIKTVRLAIFITEQPNNITKISMRSQGDISVQEICRNYFKGGGHKNASGGSSNLHLRDTVAKVKEILPLYMDMLQKA